MTEQTNSQDKFMSRLNVVIAIIVAVIALLGSFITKINNDASAKSSLAGNDEQRYYYDSIGAEINGAADVNYSFGTVYQLWYQYNVQLTAAKKDHDQHTIQTFSALRDTVAKTSPLFDPKYFDANTGQVNLVRYKADQYGTRVYTLQEEQQAAADVAAAWGQKSSTYVLQLTLLAVAGLLLGLALMSQSKVPSLVFAISGIALVATITVWAYAVFQAPVFDLRQTKAINYFADASSLSDQKSWKESLDMFNKAIDAAGSSHPYGHAYLQRARAYAALSQFESAIKDFHTANQLGSSDPTLNASLVSAYFQTGDFKNAIKAGKEAIQDSPDDLWLQQQLNMAYLANGDSQTAKQRYQSLMDQATQQVSKERGLGDNPSDIWWLLDESTYQLDQLVNLLKGSAQSPIKAHIKDTTSISKAAQQLADLLRARSIALQYKLTEARPVDVVTSKTTIGEPTFLDSTTSDGKYVYKVDMQFFYSGIETGQMMIIKVYRDGIQDPSWSFNQRWSSEQTTGTANFTISPSFSSTYLVAPGVYTVDIYINGQRLNQGEFTISDPNNPTPDSTDAFLVTGDMLDQFDFYAQDFSVSNPQNNGGDYFTDPISFINSNEDYFSYLNDAYAINANGCSDPNDLTCSTAPVDCTLTPDDPYCQQPPSSPVCASDSTLSADDPNCSSAAPQACQYDSTLSADSPECVAPTSQVCQYDSSLSADSPDCVVPTATEAP